MAPSDVLARARARAGALAAASGPGGGPARRIAVAVGAVVVWFALDRLLPRGAPLGVVLLGAVFGSLNALIAIGIVLIYRANRIVNFAQAELGAVAAVLAIQFNLQLRFPYFAALLAGLVMAAAIGGIVDLTVVRWFKDAPRLLVAVATIGLAQLFNGFAIQIPLWWSGFAERSQRFETPFTARFEIFPVIFNGNHVFAMVTVPVVLVALTYFLRFTDYGVAIRAAPENTERASLLGVPVRQLSTVVWAVAGGLSTMAILLRVPIQGFVSFQNISSGGSGLLLRTLAAAVIARMESLPMAAAAAIGLGIFQEVVFWTFSSGTYVDAMLVAVILIALLAQRARFDRAKETGIGGLRAFQEVRPIPAELARLPEVRWASRIVLLMVLGAAAAFPLLASNSQEQLMSLLFIYAMIALSLVVLTGWAGQISLGQFALMGFGAATTGVLIMRHGWDVFLAIPAGMVVAGLVALAIGLPALRISGPFLAVTTLAFATTAFTFFLEDRYFPWLVEERVERPLLWERLSIELDWQLYYLCLASLVITLYAVRNLRRSRVGRAIITTRDNEPAAQAAGINTTRVRLSAFVLSGAIAGFAGGLYVLHQHGLKTDSFGPEVSLRLFTMVVIGGLGSVPGAILGAMYVRGVEFFLRGGFTLIASGAGLLLLVMLLPGGLGELLYRGRDQLLRRLAVRRGIVVPSLLADVRTDAGEPVALGEALGRLSPGHGSRGAREPAEAATP